MIAEKTTVAEKTRRLARFHLEVAHALYLAREKAEISVEVLAERSGLSPERILAIEEGDTTSLTEVFQICGALGISIASVLL